MQKKSSSSSVKITFLGGVSQFGRNMSVIEEGTNLLVIDCGLAFPSADFPGVMKAINDFSYLRSQKKKVISLILTHGHEDHIGALAEFYKEFNPHMYGSAMAIALAKNKLSGKQKEQLKSTIVTSGKKIVINGFPVEFVDVVHSIPQCFGLAIYTKLGCIVSTGDFKIDEEPVDGSKTDLDAFKKLGKRNVLALMADSTNAAKPGETRKEQQVVKVLDKKFSDAPKRIVIASFASNIYRIAEFIKLSDKHKRRVCVVGKSIEDNLKLAEKYGIVKFPPNIFIRKDQLKKIPRSEVTVIVTGSQGEPLSALNMIAEGKNPHIVLKADDMVILSSVAIPGNEVKVYKVINKLIKITEHVCYQKPPEVHASGHAHIDEIKKIIDLTRPKYFIPIHGDNYQITSCKFLGIEAGLKNKDVILTENGYQIEFTKKGYTLNKVTSGKAFYLDGYGQGDELNNIFYERRILSQNGVVVITLAVTKKLTSLTIQPLCATRGFLFNPPQEHEDLKLSQQVSQLFKVYKKSHTKYTVKSIKKYIQNGMMDYIVKKTRRRPHLVVTVVVV
ncbi:ribonuclease J [Candidatus Margulisiibacteriota bacterium]